MGIGGRGMRVVVAPPAQLHEAASCRRTRLALARSSANSRTLMISSIIALVWVVAARLTGPSDSWDHAQPKTLSYTTDIVVNGGMHWILPIERGDYPATKPPMYNWIAAPVVAIFGFSSEPAHKWPSVAAMAVCWLVLVRLGRKLGDPSLGWLAGMAFCANALIFKLGYLARPDMLLTMWICCGWAAATSVFVMSTAADDDGDDGLGRRTAGHVRAFWICVTLAALTKGPAAIILPVAGLVAARFVGGSWRQVHRLRWPIGISVSAAVFAAWLWAVWHLNPDHVRDTLWQAEIFGRVTGSGPEGSREGWTGWFTTLPSLGVYWMVRFAPWWIATLAGVVMLWPAAGRRVVRLGQPQPQPKLQPQLQDAASSGRTPRRAAGPPRAVGTAIPHRSQSEITQWMRSAAVLVLTVVALFSLSASTRADYLAPAVPQASLLAAWWMREFRRESRVERPWLPALFAAITLATLTAINRLEVNAPAKGFGDEINRFIDRCASHLELEPDPVGFWRVGSEHGGLHLHAFLGLSQSEDLRGLKSQLADLTGPQWIIAGLRDDAPRTFHEWLALRTGSFEVRQVEQSKMMPQGRSAYPRQLTLYRVDPVAAEP